MATSCRSFLLAATIALAACGSDGGSSAFDAPPAVSPTFKLHYHRAAGDYAGWTVVTTAGAMESTASAGTPDGFGAVYTLTLQGGATSLAFSLKNGADTDAAGALTIDVSGTVREAYVISGWPEAIARPLPAVPGPDQVAVYYLRGDSSYTGWGLHVWGERVTETQWTSPLSPAGVDSALGAGFLVNLRTGGVAGNCPVGKVCLIVHKGDTKDPGPDMSFDPAVLGNIVFLLSGSSDISSTPRRVGDVGISGAAAHLLGADTLAWCLARQDGACADDPAITQVELRHSADAAITATGTEVEGGTVIALTRRAGGLTEDELARAAYLTGASAWTIPAADLATLPTAIRGQLVAIARKADGKVAKATQVNSALHLDDSYAYDGPLGVTFTAGAPSFRVWAPTAQSMKLHVFDETKTEIAGSPVDMTRAAQGVWEHTAAPPAWKGNYYRFEVKVYHPVTGKIETFTTTDPYAVNLSANGQFAQAVDLADPTLAPPGWQALAKPALAAPEDIVLYESHIRDFSASDPTTPAERRGKYLGFVTEPAATRSAGLAHLAALATAGLTHIHLLPTFDIATVDEEAANRVDLDDPFSRLCQKNSAVPAALCGQFPTQTIREAMATFPGDGEQQQAITGYLRGLDSFNWGYDPFHYGAPEGSYASTADGTAKIVELRRMVQGLADIGLRVVMDVVYNHTNASGAGEKSVLDKLVPGYYHRRDPETGFVYTSSCCANTATEHRMMERLMIDTLVRWARDYKIDGFRFDLMGLHTKANMVKVRAALDALTVEQDGVDGPSIYIYGEGWDMGELPSQHRATQLNMAGTGIGTFNDRVRDGVRGGGPFDSGAALRINQGFATGLHVDPNEAAPAPSQTTRDLLNRYADYVKMSLAGNLRDFRILNSNGVVVAAGAIGYQGKAGAYTEDPQENIIYAAAHDNQDLWDIEQLKLPTATPTADRVRAHDIALSAVLLGQGVPFVHMGDDLLRSKSVDGNSYDSGDWFNLIDWSGQKSAWKTGRPPNAGNDTWTLIKAVFGDATAAPGPTHIAAAAAHVRELLRVRKSSPLFRLRTKAEVMKRVDFPVGGPDQPPGVVVMTIADGACAGADLDAQRDGLIVIINAGKTSHTQAVTGAEGAQLHPVLAASADAVVRGASVAGNQLTVPARTTAVFEVAQSGERSGGPPCNNR